MRLMTGRLIHLRFYLQKGMHKYLRNQEQALEVS